MSGQASMSRRKFLRIAGGAVGVSVLACCGGGALATYAPRAELLESSYGGEGNVSRILVAYASKAGSTGEVADAIGQALSATGTTVTVRPVKEVADVSGYDAVVVGSAIRIGNWLPEAKAFLETHHAALERMPVACFSVCLRVTEDSPEARQEVERYNDAAGALIAPVSAAVFGGEMDYSRLSFVERMMMKAMNAPEGDWRDWEAIHVWAESLRLTLIGG